MSFSPKINLNDVRLKNGFFSKKQLFCSNKIISWSHYHRFMVALKKSEQFENGYVLDYGCGDGTYVALLASHVKVKKIVGAELDINDVSNCQRRLGDSCNVEFVLISDLDGQKYKSAFDAVVCLEVLEHAFDPYDILLKLSELIKPKGCVLISIPVEIGPAILVKEWFRTLSSLKKGADYSFREKYSFSDLWKSVWAVDKQHLNRKTKDDNGFLYHEHYGFNWKVLRKEILKIFTIEKEFFSPFPRFSFLASQAWFICRKKMEIFHK